MLSTIHPAHDSTSHDNVYTLKSYAEWTGATFLALDDLADLLS